MCTPWEVHGACPSNGLGTWGCVAGGRHVKHTLFLCHIASPGGAGALGPWWRGTDDDEHEEEGGAPPSSSSSGPMHACAPCPRSGICLCAVQHPKRSLRHCQHSPPTAPDGATGILPGTGMLTPDPTPQLAASLMQLMSHAPEPAMRLSWSFRHRHPTDGTAVVDAECSTCSHWSLNCTPGRPLHGHPLLFIHMNTENQR